MKSKLNDVLKEVLVNIKPKKEIKDYMQDELSQFTAKTNKRIKKLKIDAEIFVGGSFAKDTLVKKGSYDIDLFLRFDKKYPESDYTKLTKKILRKTKKVVRVHGSRDYFKVKINPWFWFEIVPVTKVNNPKEANNITDLSFSHVKYINKKIKSKKILDEIKLGKAFCAATETYGAESYVHGFSGYSLELMIYYYKTFEKFLKEMTKKRKDKFVIDMEKHYKNSKEVMLELNGSKLISPIILIDPTYKERNALAGLSKETFEKFQKCAKDFLKNPTAKAFEKKKIDLDKVKAKAKKNNLEFIEVKTKTVKEAGDIAGTKLLKFHKHLIYELSRYFEVEDESFKYLKTKESKAYFVLKRKDFLIFPGPLAKDEKNCKCFKEEHEKIYEENGRLFAKQKLDFTIKEFFGKWLRKNKKKIKAMYISKINIK